MWFLLELPHSVSSLLFPLQQLESVWWMEDGGIILSSHSDGSYCHWTVTGEDPQTEPEKQETPYGKMSYQPE